MGFFARKRKEREEAKNASLVEVLTAALGQALGRTLDAQSHQIEQSSRFLDQLQDLSARKAAQVMGSRGGRVTQARLREKRKASASRPACPLCENPNRRGVTLEMISLHNGHGDDEVKSIPYSANGAANE